LSYQYSVSSIDFIVLYLQVGDKVDKGCTSV